MKYSPSAKGFFTVDIHGTAIPADAIDLTPAQYQALMAAQAKGQIIVMSGTGPVAADPVAPVLTPGQIARQIDTAAYARMEALYGFADASGVFIDRRESVMRYFVQLGAMGTAAPLTDGQKADVQVLLSAANVEQALLDKAKALKAQAANDAPGALAAAALNATWPAAPAGLAALVAEC